LLQGKEAQQLFNTTLETINGKNKETLAINFRCLLIQTDKGGSGDALILLQPIANKKI